MWTALFYKFRRAAPFLTSGGLGTMGYGFPAAIGAQLGNPGRRVIDIAGDGSIQMNIQELATAVQEGLPVIVAILNNGYLGMVRQWQELFYKRRYSSICLSAPVDCPRAAPAPGDQCPPYIAGLREAGRGLRGRGPAGHPQRGGAPRPAGGRRGHATGRCFIDFLVQREANVWPDGGRRGRASTR